MKQFPKFPDNDACPKCRCEQMNPAFSAYQIGENVICDLIVWMCPDCGYECATLCADAQEEDHTQRN